MRRRYLSVPTSLAVVLAAGTSPLVTAQGRAPSQLVYSTYFGGTDAEEMGAEVEVDAGGNVYFSGTTSSDDYPFTDVAPDRRWRDWPVAPVTKVTPDGEIAYSTFVPGAVVGQGLAVDAAGGSLASGLSAKNSW